MAVVSSHILNGVDGTHAGGVVVSLFRLEDNFLLFSAKTDEGGRLSQEIDLSNADPTTVYELVFETRAYWEQRGKSDGEGQFLEQVVLRFTMPDKYGKYHRPIILSPNAYSVWMSS